MKLNRMNFFLSSILLTSSLLVLKNNDRSLHAFMKSAIPRRLSRNLGNGACQWEAPTYDVPTNITFQKTIIAGFPSGDKRIAFAQMEALTGLSARDEWDFKYLGMTNQPFIKSNYPHHEGTWGWQDAGDQVILVVQNIRRSLVEYHDIRWDIGYARTYDYAFSRSNFLYGGKPPIEDFLTWRDARILDEISWYGWFIDYWMEEGLLRDIFSHELTTPEHWGMQLANPENINQDTYSQVVGNSTSVTPSFDPHCQNDVSGGCHPVQIISGEKLVESSTGPAESLKIARVLGSNDGIKDFLIAEEAWPCVWNELMVNKKGFKLFVDRDRQGGSDRDYNFSEEMLSKMITELDRLITKYSSAEWSSRQTAQDLVTYLEEHRVAIEEELEEVRSGARKLTKFDLLGPETRQVVNGMIAQNNLKPKTEKFNFRKIQQELVKIQKKSGFRNLRGYGYLDG